MLGICCVMPIYYENFFYSQLKVVNFFSKLLSTELLCRRFSSSASFLRGHVEDLRSTGCCDLWSHCCLLSREPDTFRCSVSHLLHFRGHFACLIIASLMCPIAVLRTITDWNGWCRQRRVEQCDCYTERIYLSCPPLCIAAVGLSLQKYWIQTVPSRDSCCYHYSKYLVDWDHSALYILRRKEYDWFCVLLPEYTHNIYSNGIYCVIWIFPNLCSPCWWFGKLSMHQTRSDWNVRKLSIYGCFWIQLFYRVLLCRSGQ